MQTEVKNIWRDAVFPYVVYVMFFLGMGLTSGAIVHMSLDPHRYTIVLFVGMAIFVVASLLNETVIDKKNLTVIGTIRLVVFSLLLSVGIGMISGGIQHFDDVLDYAGYLIPGGILLSFISYLFKYQLKLKFNQASILFIIVLIVVISLSFILKGIAAKMPNEEGHEDSAAVTHSIRIEGNTSTTITKVSSYYSTTIEDESII